MSSVFNLHLNTSSDEGNETKGGKPFQTREAATGNAQSSASIMDDYE